MKCLLGQIEDGVLWRVFWGMWGRERSVTQGKEVEREALMVYVHVVATPHP